jgi:hypothetical protein
MRTTILAAAILGFAITANASVVLVQTNNPGFYNQDIGTLLNSTNGGESGPFPISNDSTINFPTAPDLSSASAILGNWLGDPLHLNSHWSATPISVPSNWPVATEVAVIYQFNTLGATNVVPTLLHNSV